MAGYVVNKAGATHQVTDEHFARLMDPDNPNPNEVGFRAASTDEIRAWFDSQGLKTPAGEKNPKASKSAKAEASEPEAAAAEEPAG